MKGLLAAILSMVLAIFVFGCDDGGGGGGDDCNPTECSSACGPNGGRCNADGMCLCNSSPDGDADSDADVDGDADSDSDGDETRRLYDVCGEGLGVCVAGLTCVEYPAGNGTGFCFEECRVCDDPVCDDGFSCTWLEDHRRYVCYPDEQASEPDTCDQISDIVCVVAEDYCDLGMDALCGAVSTLAAPSLPPSLVYGLCSYLGQYACDALREGENCELMLGATCDWLVGLFTEEVDLSEDCSRCDPISNYGCASGDRCGFYSRDEGVRWEVGCLPEDVDAPGPGQDCEYITGDPYYGAYGNCQGGSYCVLQEPGLGVCYAVCSESDAGPCAGAYDGVDGICILSVFADAPVPGILACMPPSDCFPQCQDCPEAGDMCLPAEDRGGNFATICISQSRGDDLPGDGFTGDTCDYSNSCQPGHICWGDERLCTAFCDIVHDAPADGDADVDADADMPGYCDFSFCGAQPGQTGDEICATIVNDDSAPYQPYFDINLGVCLIAEGGK